MYNTVGVVYMSKILVVEDDNTIAQGLKYSLEVENFEVQISSCIEEATKEVSNKLDLILLDISLPDGSGFDLCKEIKSKYDNVPIIILTALDEEVNVIKGLDWGADDYITKPFRVRELISRINSVLRRYKKETNQKIYIQDIEIDPSKVIVKKNHKVLDLTALEYKLLMLFIRNEGIVLKRNQILDLLWDNVGNFVNDNTLTVYIKRLREKIEKDPSDPKIIKTVRGIGYILEKKNE
jgi:DNA-binding response OmpR family regulator